jgi:hypothetical protein
MSKPERIKNILKEMVVTGERRGDGSRPSLVVALFVVLLPS